MSEERIVYRGATMIASWPAKIEAAQRQRYYRLNGSFVERVAYGREHTDWRATEVPCHDCRVLAGELHVPGCDVEECPVCGGQVFACDCDFEDEDEGRAFESSEAAS